MRINYYEVNSDAVNQLAAISKHLKAIDKRLQRLVEIRVSQINGCAYCVDLHSNQARAEGEIQQRLDCLPVWEESPFFNERERAALAWSEAITHVSESHVPDHLFESLKSHFSEQEIVDLTLMITLMNAWNRISVSFRKMPELHTAKSTL